MVQQHVDDVLEAVWLLRGEEATPDLIDGLPQFGQTVVVLLGIVPVDRWVESAASQSAGSSLGAGNGHTPP